VQGDLTHQGLPSPMVIYRTWRLRMKPLLKAAKVVNVVDGTTLRPEAAGDDQTAWNQFNLALLFHSACFESYI